MMKTSLGRVGFGCLWCERDIPQIAQAVVGTIPVDVVYFSRWRFSVGVNAHDSVSSV